MILISLAVAGFAFALDRLNPPDANRVRKILGRARIVPIDKAGDGTAAVVRGTVALSEGAELTAPLTGRRCVCWLLVFDEVGAKDFVELGRSHNGVPFLLRSDVGTARVIPERAMLGVIPFREERQMPRALHFPSGMDHPDQFTDLALRTCTNRPNHFTTTLRATEYAVVTGGQATVGGLVAHEADPEGAPDVVGYRTNLPSRPVLSGSRRARLLIG